MTVCVRAPASSANLGPSFDCAAVALDLWNEVRVDEASGAPQVEIEGEGADELPRDLRNLTLRAFDLLAPAERYRFVFVNRIPIERGLGSSAAAIALGLLAGATLSGSPLPVERLLELGEELEGHGDNLAAALYGGVCLSWRRDGRIRGARIAAGLPLDVILAVPAERTSTNGARSALPGTVDHADAAANVAWATLLGAGIAAGDTSLLGAALDDRLHEPYRASSAPLLDRLRRARPDGAAGVTLSGSGPSVCVWADPGRAAGVAADLRRSLPADVTVLPLQVAREGAT
ncbi:MAG: homoserine kinase, partial [Gaiellaceae bacterium]